MNNKNIIIAVAILASIIALYILFTGNCTKVDKPKVSSEKSQEAVVVKAEDKAVRINDSIDEALKKSEQKVAEISKSLSYSQGENKRLGEKILSYSKQVHSGQDSSKKDNEYYTHEQAIKDLVENNAIADSLCNQKVDSLSSQIVMHKAIEANKDSLNYTLRQAFNEGMKNQVVLEDYGKTLQRKLRWKSAGKFAWKGAAILEGLYILKTILIK